MVFYVIKTAHGTIRMQQAQQWILLPSKVSISLIFIILIVCNFLISFIFVNRPEVFIAPSILGFQFFLVNKSWWPYFPLF